MHQNCGLEKTDPSQIFLFSLALFQARDRKSSKWGLYFFVIVEWNFFALLEFFIEAELSVVG